MQSETGAMKTILTLILATILTLIMSGFRICSSQTIAIGHVSAEVVESVSVSSKAITSFEIDAVTVGDTLQPEQIYLPSGTVDLGAITINSGRGITCSVVVKPASLTDDSGNRFTLSPTVQNNPFASAARRNGSQTIALDGKTRMARDQASGLYKGSYTVVFAYN